MFNSIGAGVGGSSSGGGGGGRCVFDDGGCYSGSWEDGMAHGYGVCTGPSGQGEYAGAWQFGFEASGVYTWTSGNYFEGQWLQGKRHGVGLESKGHWLYRGEWSQGYKGRYGVRQSTVTGIKYEGTWTSGLQDGYGVETYPDGGTFQGQWMRGVRHGYGVRQSVSYDLAVRYHAGNLPASTLTLGGSDREEDLILRDRDRKIEETRGGFVLQSRTTPDETTKKKRMLLDKYGRPSIRKTIVNELKLIRQKSTGDIQEQPSRSSSRQSGGSVRSTVSAISQNSAISGKTSPSSVYSEDEGSFVSQTDIADGNVIERYLGEWKGDKRAGFGICERSDGLKYEGEWLNNKKFGYGVTTLKDGTRIEGKYKNNVLVTSGKSSKLFALRATKVKDRVEGAVIGAHRAASIATQKADIANARMQSARMKSEQAEEAAKRAAADAEIGRSKAREYSPGTNYSGAKVIANRLQEDELLAEFADFETNTEPVQTPSAKKFSFFNRLKKPEVVKPKVDIRTTSFNEPLMKQTSQTLSYSSTSQPLHSQSQASRILQNHNTIGSQSPSPTNEKLFQINSNNNNNNSRTLPSNSTSPHSNNLSANVGGPVRAPMMPTFNNVNGFQTRQHIDGSMNERSKNVASVPHGGLPRSPNNWQPESALAGHGRSYDDAYNMASYEAGMRERRKSLPSIVKQQTDLGPAKLNQPGSNKPDATKLNQIQPSTPTGTTGTGPIRRQHVDTFVIENGVRKRVKSLYGDDPNQLSNPSVPVKRTASKLPKLYALESPKLYRKGDKGSVPDVSTVKDDEVLPREVVYVMSQQRREELMIERAEAERRRRNQIVLRLGDIKDWCYRRKVLLFLLTINISLAAVFYNMLHQL